MNSINKYRQMFVDHLKKKGLEKDIIPSFIRSMRICYVADPAMNILMANGQIQYLGWNDIELDYQTVQLSKKYFEAEGI